MGQMEMLAAAGREYTDDEINIKNLGILEPGNDFLADIVTRFGRL